MKILWIIKSSRKEKNKDATEKQLEEKRIISSGSSWFLAIGILSAISIIAVITKQNFYFFLGLGINSVIIGIMHGIYQSLGINIMIIGYILTFLISGLFALIWKKSKDGDRKMYLTGLIIYSIDTVIFLFAKEWVALGFHVFALIGIYMGYKKLLERIKAVGKTK